MSKTEGVSKSQFIRDELAKNPKASFRQVSETWTAAGNREPLTSSLFYLVKSQSGYSRGRRGRPKQTAGAGSSAIDAGGNEISTVYLQIESELDKLILKAPDSKIAEALRNARRRVSAKLV